LDASFKGSVTGTVYVISHVFSTTWQQLLDTVTWQEVLPFTWGSPTSGTPAIPTVVTETGVRFTRNFVKFLKSLRFRQIYFTIEITNDGTSEASPARIFSLMTYVSPKQTVSKEIT